MTTTQKITDFLDAKNIMWFPLYLKVEGKSKELLPIQHDTYQFMRPTCNDFDKPKAKYICKARQMLLNQPEFKEKLKYIAIDTKDIHHIDIDTEDYDPVFDEIANKSPFFKSVTKSYGRHILIKSEFKPPKKRHGFLNSKKENGFGVELLCCQWSYAPVNALIHNADKEFFLFQNLENEIDKKQESIKKETIPVMRTRKPTDPETKTEDKFTDLLFNVIKNEKTQNGEWIVNYDNWFKIACTLKSNDYDKSVFVKYSHHDPENASKTWDAIKYRQTSIFTLQNIAKSVNFVGYKQWLLKNNTEHLKQCAFSLAQEDIAKAFYKCFDNEFVYRYGLYYKFNGVFWEENELSVRKTFVNDFYKCFENEFIYREGLYYKYNGVVWEQNELSVRKTFVNDFYKIIQDYEINVMKELRDCEDEDKKQRLEALKEALFELGKKIKSNVYIKAVCNDSFKVYIQNNDIKLETNAYKFCFKNKVFDLEKMDFCEPNPNDMCVFTTGYDYEEPEENDMKELENVIAKIFPIEEERILYMTLLATGLCGKTLEKFTLANGGGRNGKGVINELMLACVGNGKQNYGYTCNNDTLMNAIKDGANPAVANMNHKRVIFYREPDTNCNKKLNQATIKELTGGNEINARTLHSADTQTNLKGTHILECNEKPKMSGSIEDAIVMRLIDMGFRSRFTRDETEIDEDIFVFKGDDRVKSTEWKERMKIPMFHILLKYWKIYKETGENIEVLIPESIKERSREYLKESNVVFNWFMENFEKTDKEGALVKLKDAYDDFKSTEHFLNMTKGEKRECNLKSFYTKFSINPYTRRAYKETYRPSKNGERMNLRNCLVGYKKKMIEGEEEENDLS